MFFKTFSLSLFLPWLLFAPNTYFPYHQCTFCLFLNYFGSCLPTGPNYRRLCSSNGKLHYHSEKFYAYCAIWIKTLPVGSRRTSCTLRNLFFCISLFSLSYSLSFQLLSAVSNSICCSWMNSSTVDAICAIAIRSHIHKSRNSSNCNFENVSHGHNI